MTFLRTSEYDYHLPQELIAQTPIEQRDNSRLLVVDRTTGFLAHRRFTDLPAYLKSGDVLVLNNSRVIRARLFATRKDNGKRIEILLLRRLAPNLWECLTGSRKRVEPGMQAVMIGDVDVTAEVVEVREGGFVSSDFPMKRSCLKSATCRFPLTSTLPYLTRNATRQSTRKKKAVSQRLPLACISRRLYWEN